MSDARLRELVRVFRAEPGDPDVREALVRELQRTGGDGVDAFRERLRVELWLPEGDELLVAPSPSRVKSRSVDPPLHLVEYSSRMPLGSGQLRCSRGGHPVSLEHCRWGRPTCRRCEHIDALIAHTRVRKRLGRYWWLARSADLGAVRRQGERYAIERLRHDARRLVFPDDLRTLAEIQGKPTQKRLFA